MYVFREEGLLNRSFFLLGFHFEDVFSPFFGQKNINEYFLSNARKLQIGETYDIPFAPNDNLDTLLILWEVLRFGQCGELLSCLVVLEFQYNVSMSLQLLRGNKLRLDALDEWCTLASLLFPFDSNFTQRQRFILRQGCFCYRKCFGITAQSHTKHTEQNH